MLRKDFIEAEIQKLSQVLARILGLKNDGDIESAKELSYGTLADTFKFTPERLKQATAEEFEEDVKAKKLSAEKLNLLSRFLFESVYPFEETEETFGVLNKTIVVLNLLEKEYHQQTLENISRREQIEKFLNTRQYE